MADRQTPRPFLVVGFPRSRTAWLAAFLSYGGRTCRHEPSVSWGSIEQAYKFFDEGGCASDGMLGLHWYALAKNVEGMRFLVVQRLRQEVERSIVAQGQQPNPAILQDMNWAITALAFRPEIALSVRYEDIDDEEIAMKIFEWCLDEPLDFDWFEAMKKQNIQADFNRRVAQIQANKAGVRALYGHWLR